MYEVSIEIVADQTGYHAALAYEDRRGKLHERQITKSREESKRSNYIQGMIDALEILQNPAKVVIYSLSDDLNAPIRNGWLEDWAQNGWKNKKGKTIRNANQWQQAYEAMKSHQVSAEYTDGRR